MPWIEVLSFLKARWLLSFKGPRGLEKLKNRQEKMLKAFFTKLLPQTSAFKNIGHSNLATLPEMNKQIMMQNFSAYNVFGIGLEESLNVALKAEASRDFTPQLNGVSVGLSSGTSGNRGVFLISKKEQAQWAGTILAKTLPSFLLKQILIPWRPKVKIAFFLRANNNLYTSLSSARISFSFYDTLETTQSQIERLNKYAPDILVAPASVLKQLAAFKRDGRITASPLHIVSVAEVLEEGIRQQIQAAFNVFVYQIYQATEGFLGYTCECGSLHLNEAFVHIEKHWIDDQKTAFQPIITDFTRSTQAIVRYRLNDVLKVAKSPCKCGRAETTIEAIEGRADEIMSFKSAHGPSIVSIYPDVFRRAMMLVGNAVLEYTFEQFEVETLIIRVKTAPGADAQSLVKSQLEKIWDQYRVLPPQLTFDSWIEPAPGSKCIRIKSKVLKEGF